jgi:hypothetical protein
MYLQARENSSQLCVSDASCRESVNLLLKTAGYFLLRHASARFAQTERDERLTWSVSEYLSSEGKSLVASMSLLSFFPLTFHRF